VSTPGTTVIFCNACGAHNAPDARFCQSCGQAMAAVQPMPVTASIAAYASQPYGGFWIRALAWIIDVLIVGLIFPIAFAAGPGFHIVGTGLGFFGGWLYEALLTSSSLQGTVGKIVVGLRVTDLQGQRISFGRATGRHFAKYLSALLLGIGYLMVAFTEKKQGLHDMIAGTLVQKGRP
jgi:uncharacterized RDD family membrane protein YckC